MKGHWWIVSQKMTFCFDTDEHGVVVKAAPIARKFIGQPARNLTSWVLKANRGLGGVTIERGLQETGEIVWSYLTPT